MNKKGFTLVELLATIVIIAVIMGLVLPSATRISRENKDKMCDAYMSMMVEYAQTSKFNNRFYIDLDELDELKKVKDECDGYVTIDYDGDIKLYVAHLYCPNGCQTDDYVGPDEITNRRTIIINDPVCTNHPYNGKAQNLVEQRTGYTLSNVKRINVGTQNVIAHIADKNVYAWNDKTQSDKVIRGCEITKREITLKAIDYSFQYGSNPNPLTYSLSGQVQVNGVLENPLSSSVSYTIKDSSNKTVTLSNKLPAGEYTIIPSASAKSNYYITPQNGRLTVTQKPLTATVTASNKTYDGTTTATCQTTAALSGVVSGDTVTASVDASGTFDTKDVGTGKKVTCTGITLSGTSASNYTVASSATTTANINKRTLTANDPSCNNKEYNGSTAATCTITYNNVVSGDSVTGGATCTFDTKDVGTDKTVTCSSFTKSGTGNGNYNVPEGSKTGKANITKKRLTASDPSCDNKTYDGKTTATCSSDVSGVISGDTVSKSKTCTFDSADVGTNKKVTCTYSISGTNSGNYNAPGDKTGKASITQANGYINLTSSSGEISCGGTVTTTVSRHHGGTLSCSTNNDNASCSVSETVVTITGSNQGSSAITVTSSATTNYGQATATYTVTVSNCSVWIYWGPYNDNSHCEEIGAGETKPNCHRKCQFYFQGVSDTKDGYSCSTSTTAVSGKGKYCWCHLSIPIGYVKRDTVENIITDTNVTGPTCCQPGTEAKKCCPSGGVYYFPYCYKSSHNIDEQYCGLGTGENNPTHYYMNGKCYFERYVGKGCNE